MGEIRKIGEDYFIEFYARGLLYQKKAGKDKAEAERLLEEIEGKILKGEMGTIVRDADINIFLQDFLDDCRKVHTPRTAERFAALTEHFSAFLKKEYSSSEKLSQLTPAVCDHYQAALKQTVYLPGRYLSERFVSFSFILLKDMFDFGIKLGHINDNPTAHVRLDLPRDSRPLKTLGGEEKTDFLKFVEEEFARSREKFDLAQFTGELEKKLNRQNLNRSVLRHTFAEYVIPKGVTLTRLYRMLGFSDVARTGIYLSLALKYRSL